MAAPLPTEYSLATRKQPSFAFFYVALILLSLHWAIVLYINSSLLDSFFSQNVIGSLYMISGVFTILIFLSASSLLRKVGNYRLTIFFTVIEMVTLLGLAFVDTPLLVLLLFVVHQTVVPLILFCLDIFIEEMIGNSENTTGSHRGVLLTLMNVVTALAALVSGYLVSDATNDFTYPYLLAAIILIPFMLLIIIHFKKFTDPRYSDIHLLQAFLCFWERPNIRNVFFAHFFLQFFFTWMVIYTPLFLQDTVGFEWDEIGQILFVGLLAYVLFEYVIGKIADRWIGEKEMMTAGFVVMALSTASFYFLIDSNIAIWMIAMFMTRVGASLVEATSESYFFKHAEGKDTNLISFFRLTRPLSYVLGALLGSVSLVFFSQSAIFLLLGGSMLCGLFFTLPLEDTR